MKSAFTIVLLFILACSAPQTESEKWDSENTRDLYPSDDRVQKATSQTKFQLYRFVSYFRDHKDDTEWDFYIKTSFTENGATEHMWSTVYLEDSNNFYAILDNVPQWMENVEYLDSLIIPMEEVEDFIVYKGDSIVAGDFLSQYLKEEE